MDVNPKGKKVPITGTANVMLMYCKQHYIFDTLLLGDLMTLYTIPDTDISVGAAEMQCDVLIKGPLLL